MSLTDITDVVKLTFTEDIGRMCAEHGVDILDAVVTWCKNNSVEVETVVSLINRDRHLKARLQAEAESMNCLKPTGGRLPI
jgi:hypothetical protein